jgi:hypothetical protein
VLLESIHPLDQVKSVDFYELLELVVMEMGEEYAVQVVTNNPENYVVVGKLLMERHTTIFWTLVCSLL